MEVKYKNHTIKFRETDETWNCPELEIVSKPSLKAMKAAIDDLSKKDRRLDVKVLRIEGSGRTFLSSKSAKVEEVTATMLCAPEPKSRYDANAGGEVKYCWIVADGEREKVGIWTLYPLDARPELLRWLELDREAVKKAEEASAFKESIATFDADSLALAAKAKEGGVK